MTNGQPMLKAYRVIVFMYGQRWEAVQLFPTEEQGRAWAEELIARVPKTFRKSASCKEHDPNKPFGERSRDIELTH